MIDVSKKIREAFLSVLDGTITVDSTPVPAYHEENPNETENVYIILNQQTEEDNSNKGAFVTTGTILIDVVHKTDGYTYDTVDGVASEIMQILQPTVQTHGLTDPSGIKIIWVRKLSSSTLTFNDSSGNVMRRLLRYEYRANEG